MRTAHPEHVHTELEQLLCRLISFDTSRPSGDETPMCIYMKDILAGAGIGSDVLESAPGRGNLVGRLIGDGSKRPLLLLGHADVVPAMAKDWSVPPFEGVLKDGFIWGRGAVDCKCTVATETLIVLELKRRGVRLKRDVILCVEADEECSGNYGMGWLAKNHLDKVNAEYCINEGGGNALPFEGKNIYLCQNAEKGAIQLKLSTHGVPAHGSVPRNDNAIAQMTEALHAIAHASFPIRRTKTVEKMLNRFGEIAGFPLSLAVSHIFNPLLSDLILSQVPMPELRDALSAMIRDTISPTIINAGYKENVIPEQCEAVLDCRILPGTKVEGFIRKLRRITGLNTIEPLHERNVNIATESTINCEFYRVIESVIREHDPSGVVIPFLTPGATDSRFLRPHGVIAYGFHPMFSKVHPKEYIPTAHGIDERIPTDALHSGFDILWDLVIRLAT
jgi:acetylornithine deacetylase/succinyl-diaminopimelate desuccinylase-like protein